MRIAIGKEPAMKPEHGSLLYEHYICVMHILIASAFDPIPSDGLSLGRYHFLSMALKERGHQVTYLCSRFSHALKKFRIPEEERFEEIIYIKIPSTFYGSNLSLSRLFNHYRLGKNVVSVITEINKNMKIDLIFSSSPPLLWSNNILKFAKKNGIKSVLDIQDSWPKVFESVNPFFYKASLEALPLKILNKQNIQLADAVTSVSHAYLPVDLSKPGGVFYLGAPALKIQDKIKDFEVVHSDKLKFVFMGNTSNHKYLLQFLERNTNENILVNYIGACDDKRIRTHKLVHYHGSLYGVELCKNLISNDYGLFINDHYKQIFMPNKLFYYWSCGLPVLGIDIQGEAREFIETMQGKVYNNTIPDFNFLKAHRISIDRNEIKREALINFDEKIIYNRFADFLEENARN